MFASKAKTQLLLGGYLLLAVLLFAFNLYRSVGKEAPPLPDFSRGKLACKAVGEVSVNGYTLDYVSSYRLNENLTGTVSISGEVHRQNKQYGVLGIQSQFTYVQQGEMVRITLVKSVRQLENEVPEEVIRKIIPKVYYENGTSQAIAFWKLGRGYRMDYNTYPTTYCG